MQANLDFRRGWGVGGCWVFARGAMCKIKELLIIPMIKFLKFHPRAASFCLASLQKTDAEYE